MGKKGLSLFEWIENIEIDYKRESILSGRKKKDETYKKGIRIFESYESFIKVLLSVWKSIL